MKILMINSVCGYGSTGRICTDLADALVEKGHTVKIAYGRENVPEKYMKYAVRINTDIGVKFHGIRSRLLDDTGFGSKKATEKFIEWVREYDPDIIHLHNIHGYYINIDVLFRYLTEAKKKVIWTLHDCWAFTGHCAYFSYTGCDKWKSGCFECPQKKEYPQSLIIDNSKKNWRLKKDLFTSIDEMILVTPSKWLSGLVKESFLNKYPVEVIYNGIDTNVFKPTKSDFRIKNGLENKKIILGVASVWDRRKGLDDFIKLSELLDDTYKIVLVGLSNEQMNVIPAKILGIPRTNSVSELAEIYSVADVFVNPSMEETMGLVTVEAMACGTPVITYNLTAVPEVVGEKCGYTTKPSYKEVYSCLNKMNFNSEDCILHSKKFEKNKQYGYYISLYESD